MSILRSLFRPFIPSSVKFFYHEQKDIQMFDLSLNDFHMKKSSEIYSNAKTRNTLAEKIGERRHLSDIDGQIRIVGFGFEDWERFGLWNSFSKISQFSFCGYPELSHKLGITTVGPEQRRMLDKACLDHIDGLDKEKPVSLAFFYIDTECLSPQLFQKLAERGIWSVLMGLDDKHRFQSRKEHGMLVGQATVAPYVDLLWTTWKIGADKILQHEGTPWYAPEAADPKFHYKRDIERDIDILFIGQKYGKRANLIHYLRNQGFNIKTYGKGWSNGFVTFEKSVELFNRAKIVLGIGGVRSTLAVQHLKGRDFEVPMCGAVYLTTYNPELTDWFDIGNEILCYSSPQNCAEILYWILRRPEKQEAIRTAALSRSLREHTWEMRLRQMLELFPVNGNINT